MFWIRDIIERGPEWIDLQGRHERKGFRSFSVSGRLKNPGVKLAPAGVTMRELIDEFCGGMENGHVFKGYLPGGASGGHPAGFDGRYSARFRDARKIRLLRRVARGCGSFRQG